MYNAIVADARSARALHRLPPGRVLSGIAVLAR
jgi:hypothetical protein